MSRAQACLASEDYSAASELLLSLLELSPDPSLPHSLTHSLDHSLHHSLDHSEYTHQFENANALLGSCYLAMHRADLAEGEHCTTLLLHSLTHSLTHSGFLFTALKASNFTNIGAASNLANALLINGDPSLAVKLLHHTLTNTHRSDPSGLLEHTLGEIHRATEDYASAAQWYLTAALTHPKNSLYWQSASTLLFTGDAVNYTMAESVLAQGLSENPQDPDLLFQLGE
jgi:tetratricopeptide (TPR) repeat protein